MPPKRRSKRPAAKAVKSPKRRSKRLAAKAVKSPKRRRSKRPEIAAIERLAAKAGVQMGYCVKCRKVHEISDAKEVTLKNGRKALKGKCKQTGVGMFKFVKN
jgi:hypothetical protein